MSIHDVIHEWKADGTLSVVQRQVQTRPAVRCVVANRFVQTMLCGPWNSSVEEDRYLTAKATIDLFIDGEVMAVRVPPSKSAKAQIALLDPNSALVWEFRTRPSQRHRYGVRVFGMFADKNLFVALSAVFKEDLLDKSEYPKEMAFCRQRWMTLFQPYNPNLGAAPDAYLSDWIPC